MKTQLSVKDIQHSAWIDMVQQQVRSGLSVREWCDQNQITTKTFYYRRKHVREEILAQNTPVFAELVPPVNDLKPNSDNRIFNPQMTISVDNITISVDQNTPVHLFKGILEVIRNA